MCVAWQALGLMALSGSAWYFKWPKALHIPDDAVRAVDAVQDCDWWVAMVLSLQQEPLFSAATVPTQQSSLPDLNSLRH
jgi:hypothetical protein